MCPKMELGCYLTESKNVCFGCHYIKSRLKDRSFSCFAFALPVLVTRMLFSVLFLHAELGMLKCAVYIGVVYCLMDVRTIWRGLICSLFVSEESCVLK